MRRRHCTELDRVYQYNKILQRSIINIMRIRFMIINDPLKIFRPTVKNTNTSVWIPWIGAALDKSTGLVSDCMQLGVNKSSLVLEPWNMIKNHVCCNVLTSCLFFSGTLCKKVPKTIGIVQLLKSHVFRHKSL